MPFEKDAFPGLSLSDFLKTGHDFLDSIGKVMAHFLDSIGKVMAQTFDKHLFHVIVEAEEDERGILSARVSCSRQNFWDIMFTESGYDGGD
jgi:hypothetical protein